MPLDLLLLYDTMSDHQSGEQEASSSVHGYAEELGDCGSDVSYWAHSSDYNLLYPPSPGAQIAKWQLPSIYPFAPRWYQGGITPPPRPSKRKRIRSVSVVPDSENERLGLIPLRLPSLSPVPVSKKIRSSMAVIL